MNNISSSLPSLPSVADIANLPSLSAESITAAAEKSQQEIKKIGEDFESIFLSLLLKEMRNTTSNEEGGGMFAGEGSDTYGGLFDMFIGQHLSQSSPLGIGKAIEGYLANKVSE